MIEMARESWLDVYGLGHDRQSFIKALEAFAKLVREDALAQLAPVQELVEKFCDANCTWSDHHPDCKFAQPAPVQEPVQEPVADAWMHKDGRLTDAKAKTARVENFHGWRPMAFIDSPTPPAQPEKRNFCPRCGKRAGDYIHTCTPPQEGA
jgi:hypothetical protein